MVECYPKKFFQFFYMFEIFHNKILGKIKRQHYNQCSIR